MLDAREHLRRAELLESPPSPEAGWGMCGRLRTHDVAHALVHSSRTAAPSDGA